MKEKKQSSRYVERAKIWLAKARDDFLWARDSFEGRHFDGVCFLSQQLVEKLLKAYLFSQKQKLIRTHNLETLLEKCLNFDEKFIQLKENCKILNNYYTDTRYPDIWDLSRFDNKKLAQEALWLAKQVLTFVSPRIEKQANLSIKTKTPTRKVR